MLVNFVFNIISIFKRKFFASTSCFKRKFFNSTSQLLNLSSSIFKTSIFLPILILSIPTPASSYDIQITTNIPLADNIQAISINPATSIAAAVSSQTKTLYIIDMNSRTITKKIPLDIVPFGVAVDQKRNLIIVSSENGLLQSIDLETDSIIKTIPLSSAIHTIAIEKDRDILYIGNSDGIMVMDLETEDIIKQASLPDKVITMDIDNNLGYLLVIFEGKDGLSLYDPETLEPITEIKACSSSPVIARSGETKQSQLLNLSTSQPLNFSNSTCQVSSVSVNPSTHIAVLTNNVDNSISVISLEQKALLATIPFYENPVAVTIDSTDNIALITYQGGIAIVRLENPVPEITSLIPKSGRAGDSGVKLSIEGSKFVRDTQAQFNEKDVKTYFGTNEALQTDISPEDLTTPGDVPITVTNPPPGGGISNAFTFSIYNPIPLLESITPDRTAKGSAFQLRVRGRNFLHGSRVNLNGVALKTRFLSSILLEAEVNQSHTDNTGQYPVVVINPSPGSFTSNPKNLNILEEGDPRLQPGTGDGSDKDSDSLKLTGSLSGRIVNTDLEPIEGVTIKIKDLLTETDADGYFFLKDIPAGENLLLVDGSTEQGRNSRYPTIPFTLNIQPETINEMPFQIYLHKQKNRNFKYVDHAKAAKITGQEAPEFNENGDIIVTDPEVPGFEMTIPKGVQITGWDGQPNLKVSVRTVPIDRLPVKPLPDNAYIRTVYMFYFNKIGGGIPDLPIPIKSKNDLGLLPGEKAILWYYDESPVEGEAPNDWAIAGTGTVTPDGKHIVTDPGVGISKFCCGAVGWGGGGGGGSGGGGC